MRVYFGGCYKGVLQKRIYPPAVVSLRHGAGVVGPLPLEEVYQVHYEEEESENNPRGGQGGVARAAAV